MSNPRRLKILHTNDLHGQLTDERLEVLLRLRKDADLYFDTGDIIKTGNLGIPLKKDPAWDALRKANITVSTLGNRETHILASAFEAKLAGADHPILVANMWDRTGASGKWRESMILEAGGLKVGVFGVMVPMVTERMKTQATSRFLWRDPIAAAGEVVAKLRGEVDAIFALTHIGFGQDKKLAAQVPGIDVIFGGHSHTVLEKPEIVGATNIVQGGSHGRFIGSYVWEEGVGIVESELIPWVS